MITTAKKEMIMKPAPNHTATKRQTCCQTLSTIPHFISLIEKINGMQLTSKSSLLSGNSCTCKIQPMEAEMKENQK